MNRIAHNSQVITPNGPGVIVGTVYDNGCAWIIVRHQIRDMTHVDTQSDDCLTPNAEISGLWRYELSILEGL
jgi:hypothetical protein